MNVTTPLLLLTMTFILWNQYVIQLSIIAYNETSGGMVRIDHEHKGHGGVHVTWNK